MLSGCFYSSPLGIYPAFSLTTLCVFATMMRNIHSEATGKEEAKEAFSILRTKTKHAYVLRKNLTFDIID